MGSENDAASRGIWGHAPTENFEILDTLRCILAFLCQRSKFNFSIKFDQDVDQRLKQNNYVVSSFWHSNMLSQSEL